MAYLRPSLQYPSVALLDDSSVSPYTQVFLLLSFKYSLKYKVHLVNLLSLGAPHFICKTLFD